MIYFYFSFFLNLGLRWNTQWGKFESTRKQKAAEAPHFALHLLYFSFFYCKQIFILFWNLKMGKKTTFHGPDPALSGVLEHYQLIAVLERHQLVVDVPIVFEFVVFGRFATRRWRAVNLSSSHVTWTVPNVFTWQNE